MLKIAWNFLNKPANTIPPATLPSVKTDLRALSDRGCTIVWFGHSSYLIKLNGVNILVDPVFSGNASPFSFGAKSFAGSDVYSAADMPVIDLLIITHDHYDHLDYETVLQLKPKIRKIVTSLGVGSHLRYWGFDDALIDEFDWWDSQTYAGMRITAAPARHFSGRSLTRFKTLWSSFIIESEGTKIYAGGDSGDDAVFTKIGARYGPFDLAILECGQYNTNWPDIHMMPESTASAAVAIGAKALLPVHWGKFSLALHPWNEPVKRVLIKANEAGLKITTPMIGEPVVLNHSYPDKKWWEEASR